MADISLLFDVAGGGSLAGASGDRIYGQLSELVTQINSNPFKIRFMMDESSISSIREQIASITKDIGLSGNGVAGQIDFNGLAADIKTIAANVTSLNQAATATGNALAAISRDIQSVSGAVSGLTPALSDASSAFERMIQSSVSGIDSILVKLNSLHALLDSLNEKEINVYGGASYAYSEFGGHESRSLDQMLHTLESISVELTAIRESFAQINELVTQINSKEFSVQNFYDLGSASSAATESLRDYRARLTELSVLVKSMNNDFAQLAGLGASGKIDLNGIAGQAGNFRETMLGAQRALDGVDLDALDAKIQRMSSASLGALESKLLRAREVLGSFLEQANQLPGVNISYDTSKLDALTAKKVNREKLYENAVNAATNAVQAQNSASASGAQTQADSLERLTTLSSDISGMLDEVRAKLLSTFDLSTVDLHADGIKAQLEEIVAALDTVKAGFTTVDGTSVETGGVGTTGRSGKKFSGDGIYSKSELNQWAKEEAAYYKQIEAEKAASLKAFEAEYEAHVNAVAAESKRLEAEIEASTAREVEVYGSSGYNPDMPDDAKAYAARMKQMEKFSDLQRKIVDAERKYTAAANGSASTDYSALSEYRQELSGLLTQFDRGDISLTEFGQGVDSINKKFAISVDNIQRAGEAYKSVTGESLAIKDSSSMLSESDKTLKSLEKDTTLGDAERAKVGELRAEYDRLRVSVEEAKRAAAAGNNVRTDEITRETAALKENVRALEAQSKFGSRMDAMQAKANTALEEYSGSRGTVAYREIKAASEELDAMRRGLKVVTEEDLNRLENGINENVAALDTMGKKTKSFFSSVGDQIRGYVKYFAASQLILRAVTLMKKMVSTTIELDSAMTQLKIVTGASDSQMQSFLKRSAVLAKELGKNISEVMKSVETFSRLGYNLDDASVLAEYATLLSNVADVEVDAATSGLTSIIKGYGKNVDEAEHVSDVLIEVGQKYAVSASEMMEAYERSGAALNAANTSFEKSAGLIAAANAAIQNASTVGTALKTISARIRGSKSELEELGEETEDLADGFSKYADEIKQLTGFNIMVDGSTNQFKDIYDIFEGIAGVWDKLSDTSQARVAEILGGTRQLQVITSIITNWKDAAGAYAASMDSAGVATESNAVYMESIEGRIGTLTAKFQEAANAIVSSGIVKGVIDIGSGLMSVVGALAKVNVLLPLIVMSIAGIKALKMAKGASETVSKIASLSGATLYQDVCNKKLSISCATLSRAQRELIRVEIGRKLTAKEITTEQYNEIVSTLGLASAQDTLSGSTKRLSVSLKTMFSSPSAWIAAASAVIGLVALIIQSAKRQAEEQRQAAEEAANAYKELSKSTEEYIARARELQETLQKSSLSTEEAYNARSELLEIQNKLIENYGDEAHGIDLVTQSIDSQLESIEKLGKSKWQTFKQENQSAIDKAVKKIGETRNFSLNSPYLTHFDRNIIWDNWVPEFSVFTNIGDEAFSYLDATGNIYDVLQAYKSLYDLVEEKETGSNKSVFLEDISAQINSLNKDLEKHETIFNTYVEGLLLYDDKYKDAYGSILAAQQQYNEALKSGDASAEAAAISGLDNAISGWLAMGVDNDAVSVYVNQLISSIQSQIIGRELKLNLQAYIDGKPANGWVLSAANMLGNFASKSPDGKVHVEDIKAAGVTAEAKANTDNPFYTLEEQSYNTLAQVAEHFGVTVDELIGILQQFGLVEESIANSSSKSISQIKSSLEALSTTSEAVEKALDEQEGSGSITLETYEALIEASEEYASCLEFEGGYIRLNKKAAQELAEAKAAETLAQIRANKAAEEARYGQLANRLGELTAAEESEMEQIEKNISKYRIMESQLKETTSAYQKYLDAKDGGESGDMYDDILGAVEMVNDVLNDSGSDIYGRTGRSDYQAAVRLLIDDEGLDPEQMRGALGKIQRYFTEDSSGVQNVVSDLISKGFVDGATGAFKDGVTMRDLQEGLIDGLTLSEDAVRAIFGLLEEYGAKFDWTDFGDTQPSSLYESYKLVKDLQAEYDKLCESGEELTEEGIETKKQLQEALGLLDENKALAADKVLNFAENEENIRKLTEEKKALEAQDTLSEDDLVRVQELDDGLAECNRIRQELGTPTQLDITASKEYIEQQIANVKLQIDKDGLTDELKAQLDEWQRRYDTVTALELPTEVDDEEFEDFTSYVEDFFDKVYSLNVSTALAQRKLSSIKRQIDEINAGLSKGPTVGSGSGTTPEGGQANAAGTGRGTFAGGKSLVGELGRELVVNPYTGKWYTVGDHGAEFVDLPKNAIVFNHKQTEQLLNGSHFRKDGHAFAAANLNFADIGINGKIPIFHGSVANIEVTLDDEALETKFKDTIEKLEDQLSDAIGDFEHSIFLLEKKNTDKLSIEERSRLSSETVEIYRKMQDEVHRVAEEYRKLGLSDNSDYIQELQKSWWEYEDAIKEVRDTAVENIKDIVSKANELVDTLQDVYDTLHQAADEYAENGGFISVDTFQDIIELGTEYMQYLTDENGVLDINEDKINAVIAAKTRQLAIDNALAYVERLRLALLGESNEKLDELLTANYGAMKSTWELVYTTLKDIGLSNEQYEVALKNIQAIQNICNSALNGIGKTSGKAKSELDDMKDGLDDILDYVMDMLKEKVEDEIDALEDMKDSYQDIIDLRKEALDAAKDESDYQDEVAEKVREIAKLQARINILSLDDSRDAKSQRAKLEEEMAELQKELADKQRDYSMDSQKDALDEMQEQYEGQKDEEIRALEKTISSTEKLYRMAVEYIESHWSTLKDELIAWNYETGSSLESELVSAWDSCSLAVERYGSYLEAVKQIQKSLTDFDEGGMNYTVAELAAQSVVQEMRNNSSRWNNATPEEQKRLAEENQRLADSLAQYGIKAVRGADGHWYIDRVGGEKLYEKYGIDSLGSGTSVYPVASYSAAPVGAEAEKNMQEWVKNIEFLKLMKEKGGLLTASLSSSRTGMPSAVGELVKRSSDIPASISNNGARIQFGNVTINGANEDTVKKHIEVNRQFVNDVLKYTNIRR